MSVSATESIGYNPTSSTSTTSSTTTGGLDDENTFLQLMVAQMKYQDPMNPTDSSQFLSQTAQFTSLEKMTDLADQMTLLTQAQTSFGAAGMIGQTVRYVDDSGAEQSGTVAGTTFTSSGPLLSIDGNAVMLSQVTSVGDAPTLTASTTGTVTTSPTGYVTNSSDGTAA